ncbi:hypothetical protein G6F52_001440 [Rhizopus delemar]|nr:hypothetical protein G6F52_001440 [Rhizopus delemar]
MFTELKVSKTTLFDFVKQHCNLSLKKARLQPIDRNSEEKIQERLDWVHKWEKTDLDFTRNCVFPDESAFHINLKRSMAWSKKGAPAVATGPKTRAATTTILGAISAEDLIKCSLRLLQPPSNKKEKAGDGVGQMSKGTVTGHYISFLKAIMDEMGPFPHMKGYFLVMDNAPIHTSDNIAKYIESRGYRSAYLPPYSPELNPIEQFWSVVKNAWTDVIMGKRSEEVFILQTKTFVTTTTTTKKNILTGYIKKTISRRIDWLQYPQLRYYGSQLLTGSILVQDQAAILLNTIEPYSRDSPLDAHYERRSRGSASSFPSVPSQYGYLSILVLSTADGDKLVIGTRTCNFLITSSIRLDKQSVNLGPVTSHFMPTKSTKVFLDIHSIDLAMPLLNDPSVRCSQSMPSLYQLRQVRSKFDYTSTYTMCRASSAVASSLKLQPSSIWTLSDQDSNNAGMSQEKVGSLMFRTIAIQVINDGENAVLQHKDVKRIAALTKDSIITAILGEICCIMFKLK